MLWTIRDAAAALHAGRLSASELLQQCFEKFDRYEARIQAWVFVDREAALEQAEQVDKELKAGRWRGPLHGIPVGIKDIVDVFDWPTAAGSKRWSQSFARRDATVVERLRQAGAVIIGKTVTTQYASFDPSPTRNPWNQERTPGGSSSGSAAAVACGMAVAAIGSQTGGSISRPASYCGVAGCKPSRGRVSTDGIVPLAPSMDHPGPIAACVADLAIVLQTIAGPDYRDENCAFRLVPDYLAGLEHPKPPKIGRVRGLFHDLATPATRSFIDEACAQLENGGAWLQSISLPAAFAEVLPRHRTVMAVEAAVFHGARLRLHPDEYLPNIRKLLEEGLACPAPEYARCKDHQKELSAEMEESFGECDVLITPATTSPAPPAATTGDPAFNSPWSYTGLPTISLPAGRDEDGMPMSIQLTGKRFGEAELFAAAAWCERIFDWKRVEPA